MTRLEKRDFEPLAINANPQAFDIQYHRIQQMPKDLTIPVFTHPRDYYIASPELTIAHKNYIEQLVADQCQSKYPRLSVEVEVLQMFQELRSTHLNEKTRAMVEVEVTFFLENGTSARAFGSSKPEIVAIDASVDISERLLLFAIKDATYIALKQIEKDLDTGKN